MALEQRSAGYAKGRAALLAYCRENDIFRSIHEYAFEWPSRDSCEPSPPPDLNDVLPSFDPLEDELVSETRLDIHPDVVPFKDDIYDTGRTHHLRLEMPLLNYGTGWAHDALRQFGPDPLMKTAASIPPELIDDEEGGMVIPRETSEYSRMLERDMKITVTQDQANHLQDSIHRYMHEQCV